MLLALGLLSLVCRSSAANCPGVLNSSDFRAKVFDFSDTLIPFERGFVQRVQLSATFSESPDGLSVIAHPSSLCNVASAALANTNLKTNFSFEVRFS